MDFSTKTLTSRRKALFAVFCISAKVAFCIAALGFIAARTGAVITQNLQFASILFENF
jgi:cytochrome c biogenesis protein CcdA